MSDLTQAHETTSKTGASSEQQSVRDEEEQHAEDTQDQELVEGTSRLEAAEFFGWLGWGGVDAEGAGAQAMKATGDDEGQTSENQDKTEESPDGLAAEESDGQSTDAEPDVDSDFERGMGTKSTKDKSTARSSAPTKDANDVDSILLANTPTADGVKLDPAWSKVSADYVSYLKHLAIANAASPTVMRSKIIEKITAAWTKFGGPELHTAKRTADYAQQLKFFKVVVNGYTSLARKSWVDTLDWYLWERSLLKNDGSLASLKALELLDREFANTQSRIGRVGMNNLLSEDFLGLSHMQRTESHRKSGKIIANRELIRLDKRLREREARRRKKQSGGFLKTVWSIVGYDSWGDFAGDVALTVFTGGAGKALKVVYKVGRKLRRARKANKIRKLRRKFQRAQKQLKRLEKDLKRRRKLERTAKKMARAKRKLRKVRRVGKAAEFAKKMGEAIDTLDVAKVLAHLASNRKKIFKAVITDLVGGTAGGHRKAAAAATIDRIGKEAVGLYVGSILGLSSSKEDALFGARKYKSYVAKNFTRRVATNLIYYGIIAAGNPRKRSDFIASVAVSTSFEMAQDLAMKLPALEPFQMVVESLRKAVATAAKSAIKKGWIT